MIDIVERLRTFWPDGPGYQIAWEAAAEIEQLRQMKNVENERLEHYADMIEKENDQLRAEIERLRALVARLRAEIELVSK